MSSIVSIIKKDIVVKYNNISDNNSILNYNLRMIDTALPDMLKNVCDCFEKGSNSTNVISTLVKRDPLHIGNRAKEFYTYKIKEMLCAFAVGLDEENEISGFDRVNYGYYILHRYGNENDIIYHTDNPELFEEGVLCNAVFVMS